MSNLVEKSNSYLKPVRLCKPSISDQSFRRSVENMNILINVENKKEHSVLDLVSSHRERRLERRKVKLCKKIVILFLTMFYLSSFQFPFYAYNLLIKTVTIVFPEKRKCETRKPKMSIHYNRK